MLELLLLIVAMAISSVILALPTFSYQRICIPEIARIEDLLCYYAKREACYSFTVFKTFKQRKSHCRSSVFHSLNEEALRSLMAYSWQKLIILQNNLVLVLVKINFHFKWRPHHRLLIYYLEKRIGLH